MLDYFILTTENGFVSLCIVSLLLAYVKNGGSVKRKKSASRSLIAGVSISVVLCLLKYQTIWINREIRNIIVLGLAISAQLVFFLSFMIPVPKRHFLRTCSLSGIILLLIIDTLPDILLYPSGFGLMGSSGIFSSDILLKSTGFLLGLATILFAGYAIHHSAGKLNQKILSSILVAVLGINVFVETMNIVQPLLARRIIPFEPWLFNIMIFVINYKVVFVYLLIAVTVILPVIVWIRSSQNLPQYHNPAEHRKIKAGIRMQKRWAAAGVFSLVAVTFSLTALKAYNEREIVLSPIEESQEIGDELLIDLNRINDGLLHRFAHTAEDGTEVRFIVIKKNETAYGVGLDACEICGPVGYYQKEDEVVCLRCDVIMNKMTIGFHGGCNPIPLEYKIKNGIFRVNIANFEAAQVYFEGES